MGPTLFVPLIGEGDVAKPVRLMTKEGTPSPLLAIASAAVLVPRLEGAKRIVKVVLPAGATGAVGLAKTEKSVPLRPEMVSPVRSPEPEFFTVNTRSAVLPTATLPKLFVTPLV